MVWILGEVSHKLTLEKSPIPLPPPPVNGISTEIHGDSGKMSHSITPPPNPNNGIYLETEKHRTMIETIGAQPQQGPLLAFSHQTRKAV